MDRLPKVLQDRRMKLDQLRERGIDPYCQDFAPSHEVESLHARYGQWDGSRLESLEEVFSIAGRVMAKRDFGKAVFIDIMDRTGRIQCFIQRPSLEEGLRFLSKMIDIGDHLGVSGRLFRTRTGELTIQVGDLKILSKALRPLPEKWHGLRDVEARYRQRYLDLLMNPQVRRIFLTRTKAISWIRQFLDSRGFVEVETPVMQPLPGGAEARPFVTYHNALERELYLRIAPELYLKRLVIGGMERVYELGKNFRNEGISSQHNPEFTMLEFYQAYATYEDFMALTEELIRGLAEHLGLGGQLEFQGQRIDLDGPWSRLSFREALVDIGGVPEGALKDAELLFRIAEEKKVEIVDRRLPGKVLAKLFDVLVEPHLVNPTFVYHYPVDISPLSRRDPEDPQWVDRFELFIGGRELANAFSELTDPLDQRERFAKQAALKGMDEEAHPMDEDFLMAMEYGMPPTAGEGIGIDRLMMILTNSPSIREVILFPQLRQEGL
jgi:lysyl-tRNA synthetase class 2